MDKKPYVSVTSGLSQMVNEDDPDFEYPISSEMQLREGRYTSGDEIGRGGMKKILLSDDKLTARPVAQAKLLDSQDDQKTESFFREARITAQLQHPNIVPVYDAGYDREGQAFFTMKPVGEKTLKTFIKEENFAEGFRYQQKLEVFLKICHAIAYAHANKVVHLDLKPENIYLGEFAEVLVGDWGLARGTNDECLSEELLVEDIYDEHSHHGVLKGTPGYMAPEQIEKSLGKRDERCDIYALGAILYELLCGKQANSAEGCKELLQTTLKGERKSPRDINPTVPLALEAIVMKALENDRDQRYQSVSDLIVDVNKFQSGFMTSAEDYSFGKSCLYLLKRHKQVSFWLMLLLVSSSVFSVFLFFAKRQAESLSLVAIEQKERAEDLKEIAIQEKNRALKAQHAQIKEQAKREAVSKAASPRLVNVARFDLSRFDYDSALANARLAVLWDPQNEEAQLYLARILMITQRFNEASQLFKAIMSPTFPRKKTADTCTKYALLKKDDDVYLSIAELEAFILDTSTSFVIPVKANENMKLLVHIANYAYTMHSYSLDEKMQIASLALGLTNPIQEEIKYSIFESQVDIDFSNNRRLYNLEALRKLPIRKLNLSNSSMKNVDALMGSSVKELDIRGSQITGYSIRLLSNLDRVILSPKQNPHLNLKGVEIIRK
jgi:eukaryotic-like serine/threonine-protein kinase